jgi:serine kinase of HPr protein (carbohydrate metabolism regulator)
MIVHAGLIARRHGGTWWGALIHGPSGSGKSDLALRSFSEGFRLVADDRTLLFLSRGRLFGRAPAPLAGLIEVRGVGIVANGALPFAPVCLFVRCVAGPTAIERMPKHEVERLLGVELPVLEVSAFEGSAPAKIGRAMEYLGGRG